MVQQTIREKIQQRRIQIIFHSVAYYKYDIVFVEDKKFDVWSRELLALQQQYPQEASEVRYAKEFADWDASTGFHLIEIEPQKHTSKIYHHIRYMQENRPEEVTSEMLAFLDNVARGIV